MDKHCISCGMAMQSPQDYPLGDENKDYCVKCALPDGSMQSYEERLETMTADIMMEHGMNESDARSAAVGVMKSMPAWMGVSE